jgi:hypothetical protein
MPNIDVLPISLQAVGLPNGIPIVLWVKALRCAAQNYREMWMGSANTLHRQSNFDKATVCKDIADKIERYGSFASDRQRGYAASLMDGASVTFQITGFRMPPEPITEPISSLHQFFAQRTERTINIAILNRGTEIFSQNVREADLSYTAYQRDAIRGLLSNIPPQPSTVPTQSSPAPIVSANPSEAIDTILLPTQVIERFNMLFEHARHRNLVRPKVYVVDESRRKYIITYETRTNQYKVRDAGANRVWLFFSKQTGTITRRLAATSQDARFNEIVRAIRMFGGDTNAAARLFGNATNVCCFCAHPLTDGRSVAMGYGPTCADSYGMRWGDVEERTIVSQETTNAPVTARTEVVSVREAVDRFHSQVATPTEAAREAARIATSPAQAVRLSRDAYSNQRLRTSVFAPPPLRAHPEATATATARAEAVARTVRPPIRARSVEEIYGDQPAAPATPSVPDIGYEDEDTQFGYRPRSN